MQEAPSNGFNIDNNNPTNTNNAIQNIQSYNRQYNPLHTNNSESKPNQTATNGNNSNQNGFHDSQTQNENESSKTKVTKNVENQTLKEEETVNEQMKQDQIKEVQQPIIPVVTQIQQDEHDSRQAINELNETINSLQVEMKEQKIDSNNIQQIEQTTEQTANEEQLKKKQDQSKDSGKKPEIPVQILENEQEAIKELNKTIDSLQVEIQVLKNENIKINQQFEAQKQNIGKQNHQQSNKLHQDSIFEHCEFSPQNQEKLLQYEAEAQKQNKELEQIKKLLEESRLNAIQQQDQLKSEFKVQIQQIIEAKNKVNVKLQDDITQLRNERLEITQQQQEHSQNDEKLKQEIYALKCINASITIKYSQLQKENAELKKEFEQINAQISQLKEQNTDSSKSEEEKMQELAALMQNKHVETKMQLINENAELKSQIDNMKTQFELQLQNTVKTETGKLEQNQKLKLNFKHIKTESLPNELIQTIETQNASIKTLQNDNENLQKENTRLIQNIETQNSEQRKLQKQISDLKNDLKQIQINQQQQQINNDNIIKQLKSEHENNQNNFQHKTHQFELEINQLKTKYNTLIYEHAQFVKLVAKNETIQYFTNQAKIDQDNLNQKQLQIQTLNQTIQQLQDEEKAVNAQMNINMEKQKAQNEKAKTLITSMLNEQKQTETQIKQVVEHIQNTHKREIQELKEQHAEETKTQLKQQQEQMKKQFEDEKTLLKQQLNNELNLKMTASKLLTDSQIKQTNAQIQQLTETNNQLQQKLQISQTEQQNIQQQAQQYMITLQNEAQLWIQNENLKIQTDFNNQKTLLEAELLDCRQQLNNFTIQSQVIKNEDTKCQQPELTAHQDIINDETNVQIQNVDKGSTDELNNQIPDITVNIIIYLKDFSEEIRSKLIKNLKKQFPKMITAEITEDKNIIVTVKQEDAEETAKIIRKLKIEEKRLMCEICKPTIIEQESHINISVSDSQQISKDAPINTNCKSEENPNQEFVDQSQNKQIAANNNDFKPEQQIEQDPLNIIEITSLNIETNSQVNKVIQSENGQVDQSVSQIINTQSEDNQ
ncbi:Hypothetical_protein [Hexamita inflata]|uniref:Hypothetical_protein n=1 Tax=Hexamita inflata TaxID=28002 RepID=A0AA86RR91_9EUKA|nr:Hypothetical protein HINF_LOCUS64237 [Hexamita inflata]